MAKRMPGFSAFGGMYMLLSSAAGLVPQANAFLCAALLFQKGCPIGFP